MDKVVLPINHFAVYSFWEGNKCWYVGWSRNILKRMSSHWRKTDGDDKVGNSERIEIILCDTEAEARQLESKMIGELKPSRNTRGNLELENGGKDVSNIFNI